MTYNYVTTDKQREIIDSDSTKASVVCGRSKGGVGGVLLKEKWFSTFGVFDKWSNTNICEAKDAIFNARDDVCVFVLWLW